MIQLTYYVSMKHLEQQLLLSITLLPCPPGFQLKGDPPGCECHHPILAENNVVCQFINHTGYHIWSGTLWLGINASNVYIAHYCPIDCCISDEKTVNLQNHSSAQCAFNRAGRLCGGCQNGYSLAIGSSHCILCGNNNNLALLIFFADAGFLLVAIIGVFNPTVTQGMINGFLFYANIVWIYQKILFSTQIESNFALVFVRTLIAWLNLDFGIHTCFVQGLDALHKMWPQYFFILYIWGIAVAIIFAASRSTKLTKILRQKTRSHFGNSFSLSPAWDLPKSTYLVQTAPKIIHSQFGHLMITMFIAATLMPCSSLLLYWCSLLCGCPTLWYCFQYNGYERYPTLSCSSGYQSSILYTTLTWHH